MRVNPSRYASFSARKFNFIFFFYYFFRPRRKVVEFGGLVPTQVSSMFPALLAGFLQSFFSGLRTKTPLIFLDVFSDVCFTISFFRLSLVSK